MAVCRGSLYLFIIVTILFVSPFAAHSCPRVPLIVCRWISKLNAFRNSDALSDGTRPCHSIVNTKNNSE